MYRLIPLAIAIALVLGTTRNAFGGTISVLGDKGDGTIYINGDVSDNSLDMLRAGVGGNFVRGLAAVLFFALPTLASSDSLVGADLRIQYLGISQFTVLVTPEFNADLFGLGTRSTATILGSDYFDGDASLSKDTLLAKGYVTPTTVPSTLITNGGGFLGYIASLYNPDGTPKAAFAVFRINADVHLPEGSGPYRGYEFASADNTDGGGAFVPDLTLNVTDVPEPGTLALAIVGGVSLLTTLRRRSR